MERFDTYQKRLALRSGLGQSTIASYLSGTRSPKKRELVQKIVDGLLPDGVDGRVAEQVLHDALLAAGMSAPPLAPATSLIRAISEGYKGGGYLEPDEISQLSDELEDFARVRVDRVMRQRQEAGAA